MSVVLRFHIWKLIIYENLLQNATDIITKCNSYFITKCDRSLLQNASGFFITECNSFIKKYELLQNVTILLQNGTVITKSDFYYKLRQYKWQIVTNGKLQCLFQSFSNEHNKNKFSLLTKCAYMTLNWL